MGFVIKTDLLIEDQKEIDRILAINEGLRTLKEAAFLTARAQYLTNEILEKDASGDIQTAKGLTVPADGVSGFAKGALFMKKDATTGAKGLYENQGTNTACAFNLIGAISSTEIEDGAVTDTKLADAISFAGKTLKLERKTPVNAVKALQTITSDATAPEDGDTVTIGGVVYTFRTALTTEPATIPNEVLIGVSAAVALDNLKLAINAGAGVGTNYSTGTVAHPDVTATTNTNTTQLIEAKVAGVLANEIATTEESDHLAWGDVVMAGGVDGTVGVQDEIVVDAGYIYICTAANTIVGDNWKKVSIA